MVFSNSTKLFAWTISLFNATGHFLKINGQAGPGGSFESDLQMMSPHTAWFCIISSPLSSSPPLSSPHWICNDSSCTRQEGLPVRILPLFSCPPAIHGKSIFSLYKCFFINYFYINYFKTYLLFVWLSHLQLFYIYIFLYWFIFNQGESMLNACLSAWVVCLITDTIPKFCHCTVWYIIVWHSIVQYSTVWHSTVQYSVAQYSTAQYCTVH